MLNNLSVKLLWTKSLLWLALVTWLPRFVTSSTACQTFDESRQILLNPEAQVFIGVLLSISSSGVDGSCGPLAGYGILEYEALRWGLERINKRFGQIGSRIIHDSFVPGIEIGLRLYDTCGQSNQVLAALETLFTEIRVEPQSCSPVEEVPLVTPVSLGVIDLTGDVEKEATLKLLMEKNNIPFINSDFNVFDSVEDRAKALLSSTSRIGWNKLSLIVDQESFSAALAREIEANAKSFNSCVSHVTKLKQGSAPSDDVTADPDTESRKIIGAFGDCDVILVVTTEAKLVEKILKTYEKFSRLEVPPIIFCKSLSENAAKIFQKIRSDFIRNANGKFFESKIFQMSFSPSSVPEFDSKWESYQNNNFYETFESRLITSYLEQVKNCTLNPSSVEASRNLKRPCVSLKLGEEEELLPSASSSPFYAALHGFFTVINAYKNAWKSKCKSRKGLCKEMTQMSRKEFRDAFLVPLQFSHSDPGTRSPQELKGLKEKGKAPGTLKGMNYGLFKVNFEGERGQSVIEVIQIKENTTIVKSQKIYSNFKNSKPKNMAEGNCQLENDSKNLFQSEERLSFRDKSRQSQKSGFEDSEKLVFIPSSSEIYVVGLFPVHFPSKDETDCSTVVNAEALQEVEAFLWAIDQINLHQKLLPETELGVLVLDSCGSKIRTTNQITSLVKNSFPGVSINISQILTFVTSLDAETARVTGDLLGSLNITSMNLGPSGAHIPFALQMKPPVNEQAEAIVQILSYLGWTFVSLLVSDDDFESRLGANAFKAISDASGICVAKEIKIPQIATIDSGITTQLNELIKRSEEGARGVVAFLTEKHIQILMTSLETASDEGTFSKGQLSFLGGTSWGDNLEKLRRFDQILAGALLLRDGQKDVEGFTLYYRLLTPENSTRNPWFEELWIQHFGCRDSICKNISSSSSSPAPVVPYFSIPSTPRVIQAVFSFGAALTQLLDHLCPHAKGRMCPRLPRWRQRIVLNEFLRNTEVSRVDKPFEYFQFSENFHGNAPLDIFNLRWKTKQSEMESRKIGKYVDSKLMMSQPFQTLRNGSEIPYDHLESSCIVNCHFCDYQDSEYIFIDSPQKVYVMAVFDVHERGSKPLECGSLHTDQGIQNIESLLWSLQRVNENATVKFGAVIFDSCNSKERIVSEVTNFFTGRIPEALRNKIPSQKHVIGIVTGSSGDIIKQLLEITQPYHMTTVATQARQTFLENSNRYPFVLTLSSSNSVIANSLISLVEFWNWELVSVVYSDFADSRDIFNHFLQKSNSIPNLKLTTVQNIPSDVSSVEFMLDVWSRVAEGAQEGARVILLLLESPHELLFLETASKLHEEGLVKPGDFIYVMTKSPRPFIRKDRTEALGSVVLQPITGFFRGFASHFQSLSLANHKKPYKWFREFWSKTVHNAPPWLEDGTSDIHNCKGASCSGMREAPLKNHYSFRQSKGVVETSNAVFLLRKAWKKIEENVCEETTDNLCYDTILNSDFQRNFYEIVRSLKFKGVDGGFVKFTPDGANAAATLQILNYRRSSGDRSGLVRVGTYNDEGGLSLNGSSVFTYDENNSPVPFLKIPSKCINYASCGNRSKKNKPSAEAAEGNGKDQSAREEEASSMIKKINQGYQEIYPHQRFGISLLIPLHNQGRDFFSCGEFSSEAVFQNLVAVAYALSKINANEAGIGLGAIAFDFCSRIEKAREQYFSFFSGQIQENYDIIMTEDRIVASINFDDYAAEAVSSILSSDYIPHFSSPVGGRKLRDREDATILSSVPSRSAEIRLFISLMKAFRWKFVSVVYDNNLTGNIMIEMFRKFSRKENVCIGDSLAAPQRLSKEYANELVETLSPSWKPKVIVLLMDDSNNIRTILEVFDERKLNEDFIFLSGKGWGNEIAVTKDLERISAGALTFTLETYDLPDFRYFLSNLTLHNHEPIAKEWFEEYFQHKYHCKLSESTKPMKQFAKECLKSEKTHPDDVIQDPYVFHTILGVNSIAHGLDSYIRKQCSDAKTVDQCKVVQAELLFEMLEQAELYLNNTKAVDSYDKPGSYGYHVWNFRKLGKGYRYVNVGQYKNGGIKLEKSNIEFKIGSYAPESLCTEGNCLDVCSFQSPVYAILSLPEPVSIDHNFKNVYGIVTSSLSLLGIITILVTLIYFMVTYPNAEDSSILGYFILIGCLMIYSVNFAFIFQPTTGTCSLRRFLMGLAYSIVYSAMLVKVIHSWRMANYLEDEERNPSRIIMLILVCIALIMIEIILASAWLILYPAQVDLHGELWRCAPSESFETELVISLVYVMILIATTLVFCNETWQCRDTSKQTRWILLSGLSTVISWLIWTIVATQAPIPFRDPAIVIGNLVSATAIILFLYARRFYIYSYLTEDLKDLEMRSHFSAALCNPVLSKRKSLEHEFTKNTINPLRETMPGTQFVGEQEVSFRTVTLPPDRPQLHRSSTRTSRISKSSRASRPSLHFSLDDDLPTDLNFNAVFESSEEEFAVDAIHPRMDEDLDSVNANYTEIGEASGNEECNSPTAILPTRQPSIRRVGSKQMLVFLTDGNSMGSNAFGEVSRI